MGLFTGRVRVWNPADPARVDEVEVWVDTGASYSWFSRVRLEALGIHAAAGGDTVVLAEPGDAEVIAAHTLESLGLVADVVQKKLVPTVGLALAVARSGSRTSSAAFGTNSGLTAAS